VGIRRALG